MVTESAPIVALVRRAIEMLVEGDFESLERLTASRRLTAAELKEAVATQPGRLVMPPETEFDLLRQRISDECSSDEICPLELDLWTPEGRGDVTLEFTIKMTDGNAGIEIDNLHTL